MVDELETNVPPSVETYANTQVLPVENENAIDCNFNLAHSLRTYKPSTKAKIDEGYTFDTEVLYHNSHITSFLTLANVGDDSYHEETTYLPTYQENLDEEASTSGEPQIMSPKTTSVAMTTNQMSLTTRKAPLSAPLEKRKKKTRRKCIQLPSVKKMIPLK